MHPRHCELTPQHPPKQQLSQQAEAVLSQPGTSWLCQAARKLSRDQQVQGLTDGNLKHIHPWAPGSPSHDPHSFPHHNDTTPKVFS